MRTALLSDRKREVAGTSRAAHIPAPVRGWNSRDPLADMNPQFAVQMANMFPGAGDVRLRNGAISYATRAGAGNIKTLVSFQANTSASSKLFACSDNGIYDATAGGAMGAAVSALTNGTIEFVNITNSAGTNFIWGCNGSDKVKTYNGAAWQDLDNASVPAITGIAVQNLNYCWLFKRRIFAVEENSMNAWYLPVDSIAGVASKFPVGGLFHRGGYLLAGTNWTLDGGNGPDDYCVFITSEGEIAVYAGIDPATSSSFSLIGVFYVGKPASARCFIRIGGDIWVATALGLIPLSKLVQGAPFAPKMAVTDVIRPTWAFVMQNYRTQAGWDMEVYDNQNALLVNIPTSDGTSNQFVMNVLTGAWAQFTNWSALCFLQYNNALYYGDRTGTVWQAWTGATDPNGQAIVGQVIQSYNYYGKGSGTTQIKMLRPVFSINNSTELQIGISVDYMFADYTSIIGADYSILTSAWDAAPWDTSYWSTAAYGIPQLYWRSVSAKPGFALATELQFSTSKATLVSWSGTDYQIADGSLM